MSRKWYDSNGDVIDHMLPKLDEAKKVWLYDFITQGDTAVVTDWIEGGMAESEENVAAFISRMNRSLLDCVLKADF